MKIALNILDNQYYLSEFLKFLTVDKGYSLHTISNYERDILYFYNYAFVNNDIGLSDIHFQGCRQYIHTLHDIYHSNTVARHLAALRSFWTYLIAIQVVNENPMESYCSSQES